MLHVLLTILRIIGIILLVIVGIILVLILLVLFVPVRYQIHVRKDQDIFEAGGRVTWLLHLLRADLDYGKQKKEAVIRVLGKKIKTFQLSKGGDGTGGTDIGGTDGSTPDPGSPDPSKAPDQAEEAKTSDQTEEAKTPDQAEEAKTSDRIDESKAADKEKPSGDQSTNEQLPEEQTGLKQDAGQQKDTAHSSGQGTDEEGQGPGSGRDIAGIIEKIIGKVLQIFEKLLDFILRALHLPYEIYDKADGILDRIEEKIRTIRRKVEPFLTIEAEHVLGKLLIYLRELIRRYGPRKITGYIRFGTGFPDMTGKITGLIYVLLPRAGRDYSVEPDFYEAQFETDTTASGHIRMNHLVWIAVKLLLNKEFRTLIAKIRGKDKAKAHKGTQRDARSMSAAGDAGNGGSGFDEMDENDFEAGDVESSGRSDSHSEHRSGKKKACRRKAGRKKIKQKKTGNRKTPKKK